jgi:hypothetical protein
MNFDLAVFLPEQLANDLSLFDSVDAVVKPLAAEKRLRRWHPYERRRPYVSIEHPPMAFISEAGSWYEPDINQEKPAQRLVKRRQRTFKAIQEEEQARDPEQALARCLLRMSLWEADHPFPLTPWRQIWRQALLDHASLIVVYLACDQLLAL